ncbi:MAG: hypothetical protein Ct9H300mP30_2050 [Methanobacteriota archaeon]|nr:MAG: hypothetical protein Ct9H300mP30_2050 [Euryarchaeota archaeon]
MEGPRASTAIALLLLSSTLVGCSGLSSTTPNAKISSDQQQINVGETVNFDARESSTPEPTFIDEYRWDFGDGQTRETKQGIVSHTFESAGDHEVEVSVINDNGEIDRASLTIFVNSHLPSNSRCPPTSEPVRPLGSTPVTRLTRRGPLSNSCGTST